MKRSIIAVSIIASLGAGLWAGPVPSARPEAQAATSYPIKIFSVGTPASQLDAALANPYVSGISQRYAWANIEPSRGRFNWDPIDAVIRRARSAGKLAMIRVLSGIYSPEWVKRRTPTLTFADEYLYNASRYPDTVTMPIPWKRPYRRMWKHFVNALGRRYDGNPTVYSIQMTGGGFIGEMTLPTDRTKWDNAGYTDRRYIRCWKRFISFYRHAFPRSRINLDITEPWGSGGGRVVDAVVAYATRSGMKRAWIQSNALRADMLGWIGPYRDAVRDSSRVTRVGYQMIGDAPSTGWIHDAFTVAIQDEASYVEVYASDVLADVNRWELRYLATGGNP